MVVLFPLDIVPIESSLQLRDLIFEILHFLRVFLLTFHLIGKLYEKIFNVQTNLVLEVLTQSFLVL